MRLHSRSLTFKLAPGLATLLSIIACGPDAPPHDGGGTASGLWKAGEGWSVGVPILEIGELAGDDVYHFVDVAAASRQEDGGLVIADAGRSQVRRYDERGRYLDEIGAAGEGPGEFRTPTQIVRSGQEIAIWDAGRWSLSRFDLRGRYLGSDDAGLATFMQVASPPLYPTSALRLGNGDWVVSLVAKPGAGAKDAPRASPESPGSAGAGVVRASAGLDTSHLVWLLAAEEEVVVDAPWGPQPLVPPLARRPRLAVQPGGDWFCAGDQRETRIHCSGPDGVEREIEWDAPPILLGETDEEVARWRSRTEALYGQKLATDEVRRLIAQVPPPEVRPPYTEIHLDVEGHLWVERGPGPGGEGVEYLVFDPNGDLLGPVALPNVRILEIGAEIIVAVRSDSLGVQYVQLLPLLKPA